MYYTHLQNSVKPTSNLEEQQLAKQAADQIGIKMFKLESENQGILTVKPKY